MSVAVMTVGAALRHLPLIAPTRVSGRRRWRRRRRRRAPLPSSRPLLLRCRRIHLTLEAVAPSGSGQRRGGLLWTFHSGRFPHHLPLLLLPQREAEDCCLRRPSRSCWQQMMQQLTQQLLWPRCCRAGPLMHLTGVRRWAQGPPPPRKSAREGPLWREEGWLG